MALAHAKKAPSGSVIYLSFLPRVAAVVWWTVDVLAGLGLLNRFIPTSFPRDVLLAASAMFPT